MFGCRLLKAIIIFSIFLTQAHGRRRSDETKVADSVHETRSRAFSRESSIRVQAIFDSKRRTVENLKKLKRFINGEVTLDAANEMADDEIVEIDTDGLRDARILMLSADHPNSANKVFQQQLATAFSVLSNQYSDAEESQKFVQGDINNKSLAKDSVLKPPTEQTNPVLKSESYFIGDKERNVRLTLIKPVFDEDRYEPKERKAKNVLEADKYTPHLYFIHMFQNTIFKLPASFCAEVLNFP